MYVLVCESSGLLKILAFLKIILNFVFIIAPIGLIIMVSIDFAKAVISGDAEAQKKSTELGFNRILYAVFLFAVPYMVSLFITIMGNIGSDYARCLELADDPKAIAKLEAEEKTKKEAKAKAEEEARQIVAENYKKQVAAKNQLKVSTVTINADGCDGVIYYENGTFYKPSSSLVPTNGIEKTKGSAIAGYNKYFYEYLDKFVQAAKEAGHTIIPSPNEGDGAWRSYERQNYYWELYGHDRSKAAFPGTSNHGWAIASDLKFGDDIDDLYWAHDHAKEYNLRFPLCNNVRTGDCGENWHIEPLVIEVNDEKAKACV